MICFICNLNVIFLINTKQTEQKEQVFCWFVSLLPGVTEVPVELHHSCTMCMDLCQSAHHSPVCRGQAAVAQTKKVGKSDNNAIVKIIII